MMKNENPKLDPLGMIEIKRFEMHPHAITPEI